MVDSRATIGFLLTRASATSGWTWISRSGKLLRKDDPGPRERDMRRAICLKCFACFRTWLDVWILNILRYFLKIEQWQESSTIRECCNWDLCEDIAVIYMYAAVYLSRWSRAYQFEIRFTELEKGLSYYPGQEDFLAGQNTSKAWFSLAHKHKDKDIHTHRMTYLTQFSIPALLNPIW